MVCLPKHQWKIPWRRPPRWASSWSSPPSWSSSPPSRPPSASPPFPAATPGDDHDSDSDNDNDDCQGSNQISASDRRQAGAARTVPLDRKEWLNMPILWQDPPRVKDCDCDIRQIFVSYIYPMNSKDFLPKYIKLRWKYINTTKVQWILDKTYFAVFWQILEGNPLNSSNMTCRYLSILKHVWELSSLRKRKRGGRGWEHRCAGSLVSARHIVTAGLDILQLFLLCCCCDIRPTTDKMLCVVQWWAVQHYKYL